MINLNELRLGNGVYSIEVGENVQISSIDEDCVTFKDTITWDYVSADMIEPIQLTEDLLLKFGFEKTDDYGDQVYYEPIYRVNRNYYICFDHDRISFGLAVFGNCTSLFYDDENLQFIHQLQNLYHSLTGQELEIKK